jgi:cobalt/nickel transport system permease protein
MAIVAVGLRVAWTRGATPYALLGLATTREALAQGGVLALRIVTATIWMTWLTAALSPMELDAAMARLGVPGALVELIGLTRRFGSQLRATQQSALTAAQLRGGFSSPRAVGRTAGRIAGVVLVRALDRADRVALAMALRGLHAAPHRDAARSPRNGRIAAFALALLAAFTWLAVRR